MTAVLIVLTLLSPEFVLQKVKDNFSWRSIRLSGSMEIVRGSRRMLKEFNAEGKADRFFMEFTNREDFGTKYLKIGDQLYIYLPDIDDVIRISGDMLKQSMMGSDVSYSDFTASDPFAFYKAASLRDTVSHDTQMVVVELVDTTGHAPYHRVLMYVEKSNFLPIEMDYFARGGRKIKVVKFIRFKKIKDRFFPVVYSVRDLRRRNSLTTIRLNRIQLNPPIPDSDFARKRLYR